ncbi:MAG: alpha/beta hydrolase-fold protein [Vicinamibacterales bacterium]
MNVRRFFLPLLLLIVTAACAPSDPQSMREFRRALASASDAAAKTALVERFVASHPNPFVEDNSRLTFFVKDDGTGRQPRLVGDFNTWSMGPQGYDRTAGVPTRIEGTPWAIYETKGFSNARLEYVFLYDDEKDKDKASVPDPLNPRRVRTFAGDRSEIRMPAFISHPELEEPAPAAKGTLTQETFTSAQMKGTRRIWVYLPAEYEKTQTLYPVAYVLDGGNYADWMHVPAVFDTLIASKRVPPFIAVFVEPVERQEEYSRNPAWRAFVTNELVQSIDKRFRTFPAPEQRVVVGSSLAGYGAVDLVVAAPDVFGLCAVLSPPSKTQTLITNQVQGQRAIHGVRFYILGALYDTDVKGARELRTALDIATADVRYEEVPEGHGAETFRGYLGSALKTLLPSPPS